jgi:hypothetical protein
MSEEITVKVDFDAWTFEDHEDFEEYVGEPWEVAYGAKQLIDKDTGLPAVDNRGRPKKGLRLSMKAVVATVWIEKRREVPGFTLADAKALPRFLVKLDLSGDDVDPKERPAAKSASARSRKSATTTGSAPEK